MQQHRNTDESSVLIMEYEDRVSRVLCRMVQRLGMTPISTNNYSEFKKLYDNHSPRFILLSLDTPSANQSKLCRYLVDSHCPATIILLSNMDEEQLLGFERNGRNAGLNMGGILRKPVDLTSIQSKLEDLIAPDQGNPHKKKVPSAQIKIAIYRKGILDNQGNKLWRYNRMKFKDVKQGTLETNLDLDHDSHYQNLWNISRDNWGYSKIISRPDLRLRPSFSKGGLHENAY